MPTPTLQLRDVTRRFAADRPPALDALSLSVERGEILALLGPSGSGKTTALRIIAGLERLDAGAVELAGRIVAGSGGDVPAEERGVGMIFQDYALFPHLTTADNVGFGLPRRDRRRRIDAMLELVGLPGLGRRYPHELSGGQQQRVALARALAPAPALMLLDEPFSSLDPDLRGQMKDELERILRATRTTAVFVTHHREDALGLADRVGVLSDGRLEQLARPQHIYQRPASRFVAGFVGAASFLPGVVIDGGISTEIGTFANIGRLPAGESVDVAIRADSVAFALEPDGPATIVRRHFQGSETVYAIELASGRRIRCARPASSPVFPAGSRVRARVHDPDATAFPALR